MKDVANFAVAHKRSHCAKHLSKKRCSDYRELYVMQDLVKTFPEAEWYFLTNEKDWIDWDSFVLAASARHSNTSRARNFAGEEMF